MQTGGNTPQNADLPQIEGLDGYIDLQDGLNRIRGNRKVYKSLLRSFLANNGMDELKGQVAENSFAEAAKSAHTIKGVSANLSFTALNRSVIALESELKAGSCRAETFEDCLSVFERTREYLLQLVDLL